ncbi:MAG: hypothetical protein M2R45_03177 [Verrucomicrobia subdivision 3 bacterium]|nr:hypothetical protein [Limisphaerales bacterium]MCS1417748.1 hypothetical protein [Limisphaerales bacterium]
MDVPDLGPIEEYIPVPEEFWSFADEQPFKTCTICNKNLLSTGNLYLVEKAYRCGEVVFEYAMCVCCHDQIRNELSQQSLKLIGHYFDEHVNLVERRKKLLAGYDQSVSPWLSHCLITGKKASECNEYQIMTFCASGDLLFTYIPCLVSGEALAAIQNLLSPKTRERLDDFVDEFLGLPPEAKKPTPYIG